MSKGPHFLPHVDQDQDQPCQLQPQGTFIILEVRVRKNHCETFALILQDGELWKALLRLGEAGGDENINLAF